MMEWFRELFTIYSTTRVVQIKSKCLAITYSTLVAIVWFAILKSYQLDLRKTYQKRCPVMSTFTTKVKGVLSTENQTDTELAIRNAEQYRRVWDTQDLIVTSEAGFIVMTNLVITANQVRGTCLSNSVSCTTDADCKHGKPDKATDGIMTGICNTEAGMCQVSAWCPNEDDVLPLNKSYPLLHATKNFTVLIKTSDEFPSCEPDIVLHKTEPLYKRRNLLSNFTLEYLKSCRYHPVQHPFCPIFIIGDIVKWSGEDYDKVGITGGIFLIIINWNCDFDWGLTIDDCLPQYRFLRVDVSDSNELAPGFNWRSAVFFEGNKRTLTKHYGIKFIVKVTGEGRKFDFLLLVLTIGASIGLFAFAPLFCDLIFDLFCYLKTYRLCDKFFSDSFRKEVRIQDIKPWATWAPPLLPLIIPPPPPPPKNAANYDSRDLRRDSDCSNSFDTPL